MLAIQAQQAGGPDVLQPVEVPEPTIDDHGVLVDVHAAGVNFIDLKFRSGAYPAPMPWIANADGVGTVRAVGAAVTDFQPGDRVTWMDAKSGYAEVVALPARSLLKLPEQLPDEAGFVLAQGLTAHYLANDVVPFGSGSTALVFAAAGGVGLLLTQILKIRGGRVIGVVSNAGKSDAARQAGADHVIVSTAEDVALQARALTGGAGVDVVFDSVGRDTFQASLASLRVRGTLVMYGSASGEVDPIAPMALMRAGSISIIRPGLLHYIPDAAAFGARVKALFGWLAEGRLKVHIGGRFPLGEAARAHRALERRETTGKLILQTRRGEKQ